MRTTVELPAALMRAAKARSAERGESLKTLFQRAVEAELGNLPATSETRHRVALPLFGRADKPLVRVSSQDLERALADDEAAKVHGRRGSRSR